MTDTLPRRPQRANAERPLYRVREEHSPRLLDALLQDDPAYGAYALGHLEPGLLERSTFWVAEPWAAAAASGDGDAPIAGLVMHSEATLGRTTVVAGDAPAVDAVLSLHPGPLRTYISTARREHLPALHRHYRVYAPAPMQRMEVTAGSFVHPVPGGIDAGASLTIRRLRGWDAAALNGLYRTGQGPTGYRAVDVEQAVYYGAYDGTRLVAAAGTHVVAPNHGVAMVGNVFTLASHRGRGLGRRVTGQVTAALLDRGMHTVVLTVDPTNTPAIAAYARLGYRAGAQVFEGRARRRGRLGIGVAWRRAQARRRGAGDEVAPGTVDGPPAAERWSGRPR